MQNPTVVLGGLGGGGDVGLALMLARLAGIDLGRVVVASFLKCSVERDRLGRLRVEGALIEIPEGFFAERRHFEDKLPRLFPELRGRVYGICVFSPWRDVEAAIDYLLDEYRPGCSLHTDLGGDAALQGYEEKLGSYDTDALAKAALAWASEERGLNSIIAVGCPGCEGGGEWLDQAELAATLLYLDKLGAIRGVIHPPPTEAWVIEELLRHADSGMLPLYHAALQGLRRAEVRRAYLSGVYEVKPWSPKGDPARPRIQLQSLTPMQSANRERVASPQSPSQEEAAAAEGVARPARLDQEGRARQGLPEARKEEGEREEASKGVRGETSS